ncbi:MAG: cupin domain-containing protein [Pirellulales bacterium]
MRAPTIRSRGDGRLVAVVGDLYRFLATGAETGGAYALWEAKVLPGGGPPPHTHSREEESFYVLDGEVTFYVGDERLVAAAGTFINMPIGVLHAFRNETDQPARMLISVAPAGLEEMFFEVGQAVADGTTSVGPPSAEEIARLLEVAPRYGVKIQLPN